MRRAFFIVAASVVLLALCFTGAATSSWGAASAGSTSTVAVGSAPTALAFDPGNGYVYAANSNSSSISVLSGDSVVATVGVGSEPSALAYDPANGYVYVSNTNSSTVSVISRDDGRRHGRRRRGSDIARLRPLRRLRLRLRHRREGGRKPRRTTSL